MTSLNEKRYPSQWTVVAHERGSDEMTLRSPCCQQKIVVGVECFESGALDVHCRGCEQRYDAVFESILRMIHGARAGWTLRQM